VQFRDTFPTHPDAKACLHAPTSELPLPQFRALDSTFPLTLISPASSRMVTSMFGEFNAPEAAIAMHPADAEARGVVDGALVKVKNDSGEISLTARINETMRPGVCMIPKGIWLRDFRDRRSVNVLVPRGSADLAGGACFNDARVDVMTVH
jgi:anaerobic selenocysteine-containing dehydrogenase